MALIRVTFRKTGRLDMGTMEVLGADPPADFEALGLWSAALVNELPPLQAVRDIRLHVLRETDSLRRMHREARRPLTRRVDRDASASTKAVMDARRPRRCWTGSCASRGHC